MQDGWVGWLMGMSHLNATVNIQNLNKNLPELIIYSITAYIPYQKRL